MIYIIDIYHWYFRANPDWNTCCQQSDERLATYASSAELRSSGVVPRGAIFTASASNRGAWPWPRPSSVSSNIPRSCWCLEALNLKKLRFKIPSIKLIQQIIKKWMQSVLWSATATLIAQQLGVGCQTDLTHCNFWHRGTVALSTAECHSPPYTVLG